MANLGDMFNNMLYNIGSGVASALGPYISDNLGKRYNTLINYYQGDHRPQLKRTEGKQDDNIIENHVGLAIDRSVSRLYQGGIKFVLPDGATQQQDYIDKLWDLNKKEILLYQLGLHGAVLGTVFVKISLPGKTDPYTGYQYPRLIALNPNLCRIKTSPHDSEEVEEYRIEYTVTVTDPNNGQQKIMSYREIISKNEPNSDSQPDMLNDVEAQNVTWTIAHYEQVGNSNRWMLVDSSQWAYDFPPILHWKNLPSIDNVLGDSEIDDAINIQDKANFVTSNTGKIIKNHAHPNTFIIGTTMNEVKPLDNSVGQLYTVPNKDAKIQNLEMQSDLASSRAFREDLKQSIFSVAREVDISTIADKLGALTNFGLKVLYTDAIQKNDTKRQLYGDAFLELNRRLLVLAGYQMEASNPGSIQWGEAMPINVLEDMQADQLALNMGIVDKETVAKRYQSRYGVDWETIQANLQDQQNQNNANNDNIGALLLRNFNRGGNANTPANNQPPNVNPLLQNQQKAGVNG